MPEISVIVPVYKVEAYLHRCVDSILSQSFQDFEIVLVDDGSPDRCPEICDDYAKLDQRIHVIHQRNKGLSAARNAGIDFCFAHSNSNYLTFIDSDDYVTKDYLLRLYSLAKENKVDVSMCGFSMSYSDIEEPLRKDTFIKVCPPDALYADERLGYEAFSLLSPCEKLFKKSLFQSVRFPLGKLYEDRFTTHKVVFQCKMVAITTENLFMYYQREGSIVHSKWSPKYLDAIYACQKQIDFFEKGSFPNARKKTIKEYLRILDEQLDTIYSLRFRYFPQYIFLRLTKKSALRKYSNIK